MSDQRHDKPNASRHFVLTPLTAALLTIGRIAHADSESLPPVYVASEAPTPAAVVTARPVTPQMPAPAPAIVRKPAATSVNKPAVAPAAAPVASTVAAAPTAASAERPPAVPADSAAPTPPATDAAMPVPVARNVSLPDIETVGERLGWMSADDIAKLPAIDRPPIDQTCQGAWVTPISAHEKAGSFDESDVKALADSVSYRDNGEAVLDGQVRLNQPGRTVEADTGYITQSRDYARFDGNIRIAEPGLLLTGDQAVININTRAGQLLTSEFISSPIHAHGQAERIRRYGDGVTRIERGIFTTCAPGHRVWSMDARDIELDPNQGIGVVRNAKLRILDVPVMWLPYYRFPIDAERHSGLLQPRFRNTTNGGFDLSLPVYLNLAPNYDATITPRYFTRRGGMIQGEFRYLTESFGQGTLTGGFLPDQVTMTDRKSLSLRQSAQFRDGWSARTSLNYVSDPFYFADLGNNLLLTTTTHQERLGEIRNDRDQWHFVGRAQSFQTLDTTLKDADRPYARLPQLLLTRDRDLLPGWQTSLRSELVDFKRDVGDGSAPDVDGLRMRLDPELRYDASTLWGYVRPAVRVSHVQYQLRGATDSSQQLTLPTLSLDSGLYFDRTSASGSVQTLEPRLFYLYTPYRDQSALPNFDTVNNTFGYEQMFRSSRFTGGDRIADANQLSAGLTSRFLDDEGSERLQASLGQILYFRDRLVQLPVTGSSTLPIATMPTSSYAAKVVASFSPSTTGYADVLMDPEGLHLSQYSVSGSYLPESQRSVFNAGYRYRRDDPTIGQKRADLAQVSFVQPVGIGWNLIGAVQYDVKLQQSQQLLFGFSYESCCWQVRLFKRSYAVDPNLTTSTTGNAHSAIFLEFTLKGLSGAAAGMDSLLRQNIYGYSQLRMHEELY